MSTAATASAQLIETSRFTALRMVHSTRFARTLGKLLFYTFLIMPPALLLVPWQQSVTARGRVIARHPMLRAQTIQAPIYGRITKLQVQENSEVEKGEVLLSIQDNDPNLLANLNQELQAKEAKLEAAKKKVAAYGEVVLAYTQSLQEALKAAESHVQAAAQKVQAEEAGKIAAAAAEYQSRLDYERKRDLHRNGGLVSALDVEIANRKHQEDIGKLKAADNYVNSAQNELDAKRADLDTKARDGKGKIDTAGATLNEAEGEVELAKGEIANQRIKIARVGAQEIRAPSAGRVVRLLANEGAEMLKEGTPLIEFVPYTDELAAELYLDGNDAPLVKAGDKVRLQFEGFPAVQFVGWPSAAVGTFGGVVQLVDATDNGEGKFRIMVVADPDDPIAWPLPRYQLTDATVDGPIPGKSAIRIVPNGYLLQGGRANGWVLLRSVPLGMELWRQLNGFPPIVGTEKSGEMPKKEGQFVKPKK